MDWFGGADNKTEEILPLCSPCLQALLGGCHCPWFTEWEAQVRTDKELARIALVKSGEVEFWMCTSIVSKSGPLVLGKAILIMRNLCSFYLVRRSRCVVFTVLLPEAGNRGRLSTGGTVAMESLSRFWMLIFLFLGSLPSTMTCHSFRMRPALAAILPTDIGVSVCWQNESGRQHFPLSLRC